MQNFTSYVNVANTVPPQQAIYQLNPTSIEYSVPVSSTSQYDEWMHMPIYLPFSNQQDVINVTPIEMRKVHYRQLMIYSIIGIFIIILSITLAGIFNTPFYFILYIFCIPYLSLIINSFNFITVGWLKLYGTIFQVVDGLTYIVFVGVIILEILDILEYTVGQCIYASIFALNMIVATQIISITKSLFKYEMTTPFMNSNPNYT